jgi:hypothetical protein
VDLRLRAATLHKLVDLAAEGQTYISWERFMKHLDLLVEVQAQAPTRAPRGRPPKDANDKAAS